MKKQFLAILSAVAVAGTVITVPLVSSQADEEKKEIFSATSDNYQSFINDGTIEKLGTHGGPPGVNQSEGPDTTPCISAKSNYDALDGIQIKLDNVDSGDVLSAEFQLKSTDNRELKVELKQGNELTEMLYVQQVQSYTWKSYETTSAEVSGEDDVYLCIENQADTFYVANIKVYKKSGTTEPDRPTETPGTTDQPGETITLVDTTGEDSGVLQSLINNDTISTIKAKVTVHENGGYYDNGSFFYVECDDAASEAFDGIVVKLAGAKPGDTVDATYMLQTTGNGKTETALARDVNGGNPKYYLEQKTDSPSGFWKEERYKKTVPEGDGEIYLYIGDQSGFFYVDNLVIKLIKAGAAEPTDTPAPTDTPTPTEVPTKKPEFQYDRAEFKVDGSLDNDLKGATLSDDRHVITSADETSVVSVWKCVFTGDAPDGLDVTATSESTKKTGYTTVDVGGTDMAISGGGAVTFYVLVNSAADDIKFEAEVHPVE